MGTLNILVVDDSAEFRDLIRAYLAAQSFIVHEAEDGSHALQMMKDNAYDVVLMDYKMPMMDGATATKLFREWECESQHLLIVALSAFSRKQDLDDFYLAGCDEYMTKPIKRHELVETLTGLIEKYRSVPS